MAAAPLEAPSKRTSASVQGATVGGSPGLFFDDEEERERLAMAPEELSGIQADVFGTHGDSGSMPRGKAGMGSCNSGGTGSTYLSSFSLDVSEESGIAEALEDMDAELNKIPPDQKSSYLEALRQCPYELNSDRRAAFLRREDFDGAAAAARLVGYWERRMQLFGPDRCYASLTIERALGDDEVAVLSGGYYVILPEKDDGGRAILVAYVGKRDMSVPREPILRAVWYLFHCMMEDPETQRRGFVILINANFSFSKFDPTLVSSLLEFEKVYLPLRLRAQHVCYPPTFIRAIKPIINSFLGRQMRMRHFIHGGSTRSTIEELEQYGIPPKCVPRDMGGSLDFSPEMWLIKRLELERRRRREATVGLDVLVAAAVLRAEHALDEADLVDEHDGDRLAEQVAKKKREYIALQTERKESILTSASTPACSGSTPGPGSTILHPAQPQLLDMQQLPTVAAVMAVSGGAPNNSSATNNARAFLPGVSANASGFGGVSRTAVAQQLAMETAAKHKIIQGQAQSLQAALAPSTVDPNLILRAPSITMLQDGLQSTGVLTADRFAMSDRLGVEAQISSATAARATMPSDIATSERLAALAAGTGIAEVPNLGWSPRTEPLLNGINIEKLVQALGAGAGSGAGLHFNQVLSSDTVPVTNAPQLQAVLNELPLQQRTAGNVGRGPSAAPVGLNTLQQENVAHQLEASLRQQQQQQQLVSGPAQLFGNIINAASLHPLTRRRSAGSPPKAPHLGLPRTLYVTSDDFKISAYQTMVRKQAEAFVATEEHVNNHARGRCKAVVLGQVGIRCRHCKGLPLKSSPRGSIYFPSELVGMYQTAQKMATLHLTSATTPCPSMPLEVKEQFHKLFTSKSTVGGGKNYWAETGRAIGLIDSPEGIRFKGG